MLVVCRCSGVTSPCRVNEDSRDGAAWCQKSWRKRWHLLNLLWSTCLPCFWPGWALQCPGAGWKAQTRCCILSSQALGLSPEVWCMGFCCCLLLAAIALRSAFWDTRDAASQLLELFSGVHIMSGLSVFSCDLGSIGCAVSKWTAAKWLSDYISGFCS